MAVRKANESAVSQNEDDVHAVDKEFTQLFVTSHAGRKQMGLPPPARRRSDNRRDILPWPRGHGIPPRLESRIPQVEIVVMRSHADEKLRPGLPVESQEIVRIEVLGLPCRDYILVTVPRRMAVGLEVMIVLPVTLNVHVPGVPIPHLRGGLRTPVRPDAELRVAIPIRTPVLLQGFPGR